MKKLNLNETVKVKLTPVGVNIFYNQHEGLNKTLIDRGVHPIEKHMPSIDKDGFTEMQLWRFMDLFGPEIGLAKPNVVQDLSIYIDEKYLDDVTDKK